LRPSSAALQTVTAATGVCHELGWNKSCIDVQGRLRTSAPDDGRKERPKHVEHTCSCY